MPSTTTTDQLLNQEFIRTLYPNNPAGKVDANRAASAIAALDSLRKLAGDDPDLACLLPFAEGQMTTGMLEEILELDEMAPDAYPRPMRKVIKNWTRTDQLLFREIIGRIHNT